MGADVNSVGDEDLMNAYAREAIDDFLAAAESERVQLQAQIADAEARTRRARAAVGMHRVMVGMLLETQQELGALRVRAEVDAAEILGQAEEEAQQILRRAREDAGVAVDTDSASPVVPSEPSAPDAFARTLDLASYERDDAPPLAATSSFASLSPAMTSDSRDDDHFFAYLRGALADEAPLGPRFE